MNYSSGSLVGYSALIKQYNLSIPAPVPGSKIGSKHKTYLEGEWRFFSPRYQPADTLAGHLTFALKHEGVNLLFFKKLFLAAGEKQILDVVSAEKSKYSRKVWFLYEWLMDRQLPVADLESGNYVPLLDSAQFYALPKGEFSRRHRILNNLPGTAGFCPLVRRTDKLDAYISADLSSSMQRSLAEVSGDILRRTSSFILLRDSRASFTIENETPPQNRAMQWGKALSEAGSHPLTKDELIRLQQIIIGNDRFTPLGYRKEGGFVGMHEPRSGDPLPDHISARWEDLDILMEALIESSGKMNVSGFHPVLTAAMAGFGFVFIHPFVDGNGRMHRYILHHILARRGYTPGAVMFPLSAAILEKIDEYRKVLESVSFPMLKCIEWEKTEDNNVRVLNETADLYRYFDATLLAEFLFDCIDYTVKEVIPAEVEYLRRYDAMKEMLEAKFAMPDKIISLLIRFLHQNNGTLSGRARKKEFSQLTDSEISEIENHYRSLS